MHERQVCGHLDLPRGTRARQRGFSGLGPVADAESVAHMMKGSASSSPA